MKSKTPLLLFAIGYLTITGLLIDGFLTNQPKPMIILFILSIPIFTLHLVETKSTVGQVLYRHNSILRLIAALGILSTLAVGYATGHVDLLLLLASLVWLLLLLLPSIFKKT